MLKYKFSTLIFAIGWRLVIFPKMMYSDGGARRRM
jgi:hypothetical protein